MASPFYVQPGNDFGQGLQGLAQQVTQFGQQKRQDEEKAKVEQRFKEAQTAMSEAFKSGDSNQIMEAAIKYPEIQKTAELMFGFTNERSKAASADTYRRVLSDPQNALEYMDSGIQQVADAGGKPYNMIMDRVMMQRDPEAALKSIKAGFAAIAPEEYKAMFPQEGQSRGIGTYNPRDYTTQSWTAFIKTGDPAVLQRYETSTQERIATNPALAAAVAGTQGQIAGATAGAAEQAKSDVRAKMEPAIQAQITSATEKAKRESVAVQDFDKKVRDAKGVGRILDLAEPLLEETTESWGGVALDTAGKLVGLSTKGAQAAAKLKILEASIVLNMPRMEGPQSNMDQMLYREAAAQLGDPTIPAETRKAALGTIRDLNAKYTEGQPAQQPQQKTRVKWGEM